MSKQYPILFCHGILFPFFIFLTLYQKYHLSPTCEHRCCLSMVILVGSYYTVNKCCLSMVILVGSYYTANRCYSSVDITLRMDSNLQMKCTLWLRVAHCSMHRRCVSSLPRVPVMFVPRIKVIRRKQGPTEGDSFRCEVSRQCNRCGCFVFLPLYCKYTRWVLTVTAFWWWYSTWRITPRHTGIHTHAHTYAHIYFFRQLSFVFLAFLLLLLRMLILLLLFL